MPNASNINWLRPIPLFPLPNCVLLPGAVLPLHFFEPRYIAMMQDVATREPAERLLAMALLRDGWEPHYYTRCAPLHDTVCVGRVIQHEVLADGKFNLLLLGLVRARVIEEIGDLPYRQALFAPVEQGSIGLHEPRLRDVLYQLVVEFSARTGALPGDMIDGIFRTAPDTALLLDVLIYHLVPAGQTAVKQSLLEEEHPYTRAKKLIKHLRTIAALPKTSPTPVWPPTSNPN
jgi:uncharacterized protein